MKGIHQRILATLVVVAIITTSGLLAQRYTSLDWLVDHETSLREYVQIYPIQAWLIGFLVYACLSLIPGTPGKSVVCGWLFGFWAATLMVDTALTIAAMVTFFASRFLFREAIEASFGIHVAHLKRKLESSAGFYLLTLRLMHAPFSLVNYSAGATAIVPTGTFWWTTQLGLLPGTMVFTFAGTRIPALSTIAERGILALLDYPLMAALLATALLPVIGRYLATVVKRRMAKRRSVCVAGNDEDLQVVTHVRG